MNAYYSDKPIDKHSEDLLDRASFAQLLSQTMLNLNGTDTFTIGLFGKWGSGKTSIVKMMLQYLEELQAECQPSEKTIVVHFDPWNVSDSNQLLSQFLVRLANEFQGKSDKGLKKIGNALENYSDAFTLAELIPNIGVAGKIISSLGKSSFTFFGRTLNSKVDSKDIQQQKEHVIRLLNERPNRVLVIIDDIDRLSNKQIRQVFQLVTSVAKFPKTTYLLAFDKEIVIRALEQVQEGDGEDYLEKVIQMPIQIPDIPKQKLQNVLFKRLEEILGTYPQTSFSKEHWQEIFVPCVAPFVSNLRDLNRLCNTLYFKMTTISTEIDFADMVAISAIEIGCPKIYTWINHQREMLTGIDLCYDFGGKKKTHYEWLEFYKKEISRLFEKRCSSDNNKELLDHVITALATLFPSFGFKIGNTYTSPDANLLRRNYRIAHPDKFDRYFDYDIDKVLIRKSEIEVAVFQMPLKDFVEFLIAKDKINQGVVALREIEAMLSEISSDRAKILFEALIQSTDNFKTINLKSILPISVAKYSRHLCLDLLRQVTISERKDLIISLLKRCNLENLNTFSAVLTMIELDHGRLSANGVERSIKKVITAEELDNIEDVYIEHAKELLKYENLFNCSDWRMIFHLLESFDESFTKKYLEIAFQDNRNILIFLWNSVSLWTGTESNYEVDGKYKRYLTKDRILEAIKEEVKSKRIFNLKDEILYICAAFYLDSLGEIEWNGHISQVNVDKLIDSWKESDVAI